MLTRLFIVWHAAGMLQFHLIATLIGRGAIWTGATVDDLFARLSEGEEPMGWLEWSTPDGWDFDHTYAHTIPTGVPVNVAEVFPGRYTASRYKVTGHIVAMYWWRPLYIEWPPLVPPDADCPYAWHQHRPAPKYGRGVLWGARALPSPMPMPSSRSARGFDDNGYGFTSYPNGFPLEGLLPPDGTRSPDGEEYPDMGGTPYDVGVADAWWWNAVKRWCADHAKPAPRHGDRGFAGGRGGCAGAGGSENTQWMPHDPPLEPTPPEKPLLPTPPDFEGLSTYIEVEIIHDYYGLYDLPRRPRPPSLVPVVLGVLLLPALLAAVWDWLELEDRNRLELPEGEHLEVST